MKKFISAILIISIMGSSTSIGEVIKIPVLIHHYYQHEAQKEQTDFSTFLFSHYLQEASSSTIIDQKEHARLPFKSNVNYNFHFKTMFFHETNFCYFLNENGHLLFRYNSLKEQKYFHTIWQPPI